MVVDANVAEIDFQVAGALHHHPSPELILRQFLLEPVLGESRVVEIIRRAGVPDAVSAIIQIIRHVAVRGDEIKGRAAGRRLRFRRGAGVQQQFRDPLVSVRHRPHQGTPLVTILLVHVGTVSNQGFHNRLVALHKPGQHTSAKAGLSQLRDRWVAQRTKQLA